MAIKANITIDQGADFSATIDVKDSGGNAYDLTNHTVASQMRKNYASTAATTFTATHNSAGGQIHLSLPAAQTQDIEPGRYLYDVEITSTGTGAVTRVVQGMVTVTAGMTRI